MWTGIKQLYSAFASLNQSCYLNPKGNVQVPYWLPGHRVRITLIKQKPESSYTYIYPFKNMLEIYLQRTSPSWLPPPQSILVMCMTMSVWCPSLISLLSLYQPFSSKLAVLSHFFLFNLAVCIWGLCCFRWSMNPTCPLVLDALPLSSVVCFILDPSRLG